MGYLFGTIGSWKCMLVRRGSLWGRELERSNFERFLATHEYRRGLKFPVDPSTSGREYRCDCPKRTRRPHGGTLVETQPQLEEKSIEGLQRLYATGPKQTERQATGSQRPI